MKMHPTAEGFKRRAEKELGVEIEVEEFPEGTKTAGDAAKAIGCELDQICKGIAMDVDGEVVVVLTAGSNRVDSQELADYFDTTEADTAHPDKVKQETGWSIGGVPPFLHENEVEVLMDPRLEEFEEVWGAAGTPEAVFPLEPSRLKDLSGAEKADVFR